jgi:SAM-dependent methyltransferase
MSPSVLEWHTRFLQQASWTKELRDYLFPLAGLQGAQRVLEVGCGTGAVLQDVIGRTDARVFGLDIDWDYLRRNRLQSPASLLTLGDAHQLPFSDVVYDLVFCHFLLLWVEQPATVVQEMVRVTRPGGAVLALAEPDYGGRIDFPEELAQLGILQMEALRGQGADPNSGRKLTALFHQAGLREVETGVLGGRWTSPPRRADLEMEWRFLHADLEGIVSWEELNSYRTLDEAAWEKGERVLYVPTFYAWGKK